MSRPPWWRQLGRWSRRASQAPWLFLWNLRADPRTGQFANLVSDDIRRWPGATALRDELADLTGPALSCLTTECRRHGRVALLNEHKR